MNFSEALDIVLDSEERKYIIYECYGSMWVGFWDDDHMLKFAKANYNREAIVYKQRGKMVISIID